MLKLTGSEKQISWANQIKSRIISELNVMDDEKLAKCNRKYEDKEKENSRKIKNTARYEKFVSLKNEILDLFETITDSRAWIDNKDTSAQDVYNKAYKLSSHKNMWFLNNYK